MNAVQDSVEHSITQSRDTNHEKQSRTFYRIYTLKEMENFCAKIYTDLGVGAHHAKELIADIHEVSHLSIKQKFSTAQSYLMLEIKHGTGYKLTTEFLRIYKPENEAERKQAVIESLLADEFYSLLLNEFNGHHIPTEQGLAARLIRKGVKENLASKIADVFLTNLRENGLVENEILRLSSEPKQTFPLRGVRQEESKEQQTEKSTENQDTGNGGSNNVPPVSPEYIEIPIPLKGGKRAYIRIPEDYNTEDCERIAKFVEALK